MPREEKNTQQVLPSYTVQGCAAGSSGGTGTAGGTEAGTTPGVSGPAWQAGPSSRPKMVPLLKAYMGLIRPFKGPF